MSESLARTARICRRCGDSMLATAAEIRHHERSECRAPPIQFRRKPPPMRVTTKPYKRKETTE